MDRQNYDSQDRTRWKGTRGKMLDTNLLQITTVIFTHKLLTFWQQLLSFSEWLLPT